MTRLLVSIAFIAAGLFSAAATAQEPASKLVPAQESPAKSPTKSDKPAKIYDESADAKAAIDSAIVRAQRDHSRVLVMFGGNWCIWCHKLHDLFRSDPGIARTLLYEYQLVMVDIGQWNKNMEIAKKFGADLEKAGVPFLTVLDGDGKVVANQDSGALEAGDHHDPKKVAAFLDRNKVPQVDAQTEVKAALTKAAAEDKRVFLHFGAPWCGWCHRLEDFMARPEIEKLLTRDFVEVKVDLDRMVNAKEVAEQYHKPDSSGIPWIAILDSHGKVLTNSDAAKGNIGYPAKPEEIAHFVKMLETGKKNLTDSDIKAIETALQEAAPK